eukprot:TRINITY_DN6847_c0_g1_i3.p1 TRINITY_DN6847_c0_g1~~TRINITY_DN6847_c0_g1_i3.p1  ORF type:complete len:124 (-),score=18.33 TRINITY_DN6847_c0_g1_i3:62-433(-)
MCTLRVHSTLLSYCVQLMLFLLVAGFASNATVHAMPMVNCSCLRYANGHLQLSAAGACCGCRCLQPLPEPNGRQSLQPPRTTCRAVGANANAVPRMCCQLLLPMLCCICCCGCCRLLLATAAG